MQQCFPATIVEPKTGAISAYWRIPINKTGERFYCPEEPIVTRSYAMKESRHAYKRKHRSAALVKTWKLCEPLNNRTYHAERSLMSAGKEQLNLGRDIALPLHRESPSFSRSSFFSWKKKEREREERIPAQWSKFDYKGERCRGEDWSFQLERGFPSKAIKSMRRINTHVLAQKRRCALPFLPRAFSRKAKDSFRIFPNVATIFPRCNLLELVFRLVYKKVWLFSSSFSFFFFLIYLGRNYASPWNNLELDFFSNDVLFIYKNKFLRVFCYSFG